MKSKDLRKCQALAALGVALCLALSNAQAGMFESFAFTGDTDCGIDSTNTYTHAYNLGSGTPGLSINGVSFTDVDGTGTIPAAYNFTLTGCHSAYDREATSSNIGGNIDTLLKSFNNGGSSFRTTYPNEDQVLTLTGLTPGVDYVFTFYNKTWGDEGTREVNITATGYSGTYLFDENDNLDGVSGGSTTEEDGYGVALAYSYTAPESGTLEISIDPIDTYVYNGATMYNTYHIYAFTNEVASVPEPGTVVLLLSTVAGFCLFRRRGR